MDFDELKNLWAAVGASEKDVAFERSLLRSLGASRLGSSMAKLRLTLWLELLVGIPVILLTGSYLADNIMVVRYAVPAVLLHLIALAAFGAPIWQLYLVSQIDLSGPVVTIQKRLGVLRASRVVVEGSVLVLAPLIWTPLAIVAAHGLFGVDLYRAFGWPWIAANAALGIGVLLVAVWASRRHRDRVARSPFWRRVADGLAGRRLVEAQGFLTDIGAFEAEAAPGS